MCRFAEDMSQQTHCNNDEKYFIPLQSLNLCLLIGLVLYSSHNVLQLAQEALCSLLTDTVQLVALRLRPLLEVSVSKWLLIIAADTSQVESAIVPREPLQSHTYICTCLSNQNRGDETKSGKTFYECFVYSSRLGHLFQPFRDPSQHLNPRRHCSKATILTNRP